MTFAAAHTSRRHHSDVPALLVFAGAVLLVAVLGGIASSAGVDGWYGGAEKPGFTPPNWLFSPVWTTLYAAMALAAWLIHRRRGVHEPAARRALWLWWVQLAVNLAWSPVFFAAQLLWAGLGVIIVLDVLVAALIWQAWRVHRVAAALLAPYLAWILYATALNAGIAVLN